MQIPGQIPGNLADFDRGRAGAGECFFGRGRGPGRSLDPVQDNGDINCYAGQTIQPLHKRVNGHRSMKISNLGKISFVQACL